MLRRGEGASIRPNSLILLSLLFFGYLALASLGAALIGRPLEPLPLLLALAGWAALAAGYALIPSPPSWTYAAAIALLALGTLGRSPAGLALVTLLTLAFAALRRPLEEGIRSAKPRSPASVLPALSVGLILYSAGAVAFGLPLVQEGASRAGSVSRVFGLATLLLTSATALSGSAPLAAASSILGLLTGFRSYAALPALAWAIPRASSGSWRRVLAFAAVVAAGGAALGAMRGITGEPDPLGVVSRASFTYWVYETIALNSLPWGLFRGGLLFSTDPRREVARLFGRGATRYTYFIMGQPVGDFGLLAPLEALAMGVALRDSGEGSSGALALAYLSVAVETGLDPLVLGVLLTCAYVSRVRSE
ncbi:MAG: hypothetical protein DRO01_01860 [Thermoproteota archaeon]|nr:MAG: hypothetical protein DRO01_01860 [Candidatus Korarchaeota archaeon]